MKLYQKLATLISARKNCEGGKNPVWFERHTDNIEELVKEHTPSGGGFDAGTKIDLLQSTSEKLIFTTSFHHMDEHGGYDGWTEHTVTVRPSLQFDYLLTIGGRDKNDIKGYIGEVFQGCLGHTVI